MSERSLKIVCPICRAQGEFVYERQEGPYGEGQVTFKSLSRGFTYRSTGGTLNTVLITCLKCHVKVDYGVVDQP
jgi:hypothetical protein